MNFDCSVIWQFQVVCNAKLVPNCSHLKKTVAQSVLIIWGNLYTVAKTQKGKVRERLHLP